MCVQEKLNVWMEVQSKKLEKFLNTSMWFHREIFISHSPGTSDEFKLKVSYLMAENCIFRKMKLAVTGRKVG